MFLIRTNDKEQLKNESSLLKLSLIVFILLLFFVVYRIWAWYGCLRNLEEIGTACEMYSTDGAGHYPPDTSYLEPDFINMPKCPTALRDTYSDGFVSNINPDAYTFYCSAGSHFINSRGKRITPSYNSTQGLVISPEEMAAKEFIDKITLREFDSYFGRVKYELKRKIEELKWKLKI